MPRAILDEAQIHPAIRERVAGQHADIVHEVQRGVAAHPVVVVGMAQNPFPRRGTQRARRGRHRPPLPRVRQLLQRLASPQRAEDVDRLADVSDGVRAGTLVGGADDLIKLIDERRVEAPARLSCGPPGRDDNARHANRSLLRPSHGWAIGLAAAVPASAAAAPPIRPPAACAASSTRRCAAACSARSTRPPAGRADRRALRSAAGAGAQQAARPGVLLRRRTGPERDRDRAARWPHAGALFEPARHRADRPARHRPQRAVDVRRPTTRRRPLAELFDPQRQRERLARCLATLKKLPYGDLRFFTTTHRDAGRRRGARGARRRTDQPRRRLVRHARGARIPAPVSADACGAR